MPENRVESLTVKEYAERERVHPDTVRRWARAGLLAVKRMGRRGHWRVLVGQPQADDAVDPHADSTGKLTTRAS